MKFTKIAAAVSTAASMAFASFSANAGIVNVGGVQWNTDTPFIDFTASSTLYENVAVFPGQELAGYGTITQINGTASFCSGCFLAYTFDSYFLQNPVPLTGANGEEFSFSGGLFNFYVLATEPNFLDPSSFVGAGTPWLTLAGAIRSGSTLVGEITSAGFTGEGNGFLDVTGGLAADYFDTNTEDGADFLFTSEFQPLGGTIDGTNITHVGTATISGDSQDVPEPGVLALLGLGLAGLGFARRAKKSA